MPSRGGPPPPGRPPTGSPPPTRRAPLGLKGRVEPEKPMVWFRSATPGATRKRSRTSRTTASVRCSDAPPGNCTLTMKLPWSTTGTKPRGTA